VPNRLRQVLDSLRKEQSLLQSQLAKVSDAIAALGGVGKEYQRRQRIRKVKTAARRIMKMTAAQRKAVSQRMKAYWAARRAKKDRWTMDKQPTRRFVVTSVVAEHTTTNGNHFITWSLDGEEGHLAIWGTPGKNMDHVTAFHERAKAGFPITLECEWISPTDQYWHDEHRHRYWAYERYAFRVARWLRISPWRANGLHSSDRNIGVRYDQVMPHNDRDVIESAHDRKPSLAWDELRASSAELPIHPRIHDPLITAIQHKHFVTLTLGERREVFAEPHVYGLRQNHPTLLVFDAEGNPPWQLIDVREIEGVRMWPNHFTKRELPSDLDPSKN
jgi:hypothetical protein